MTTESTHLVVERRFVISGLGSLRVNPKAGCKVEKYRFAETPTLQRMYVHDSNHTAATAAAVTDTATAFASATATPLPTNATPNCSCHYS